MIASDYMNKLVIEGAELLYQVRLTASKPQACLVLLHGVGGNETNVNAIAELVDPRILVVMPRGPIVLSAQAKQFGWFPVTFLSTGPVIDADAAEKSRLGLIKFTQQIQDLYHVDHRHTVIAGFSQGGIMSASVALTQPKIVTGFGILSGRILPEINSQIRDIASLKHLNGFIAHGEYDSKLPVSWANRSDEMLSDLGVPHLTKIYPINHEISPDMLNDFLVWLYEHALPAE